MAAHSSLSHIGQLPVRSRHSLRFRTQPVTLTEINETDEEPKPDVDREPLPRPTGDSQEDFLRLEHLTLSENIRRAARKKAPLKNFLERRRLIAMREEPSDETDAN